MVPAGGPYRVSLRVFIAINSTGTGNFHKLVPPHKLPLPAIPFRKRTRFDIELLQRQLTGFAVVGINHYPLPGIKPFPVNAIQQRRRNIGRFIFFFPVGYVPVFIQQRWFQRVDIHFIEAFLHRSVINFSRRIKKMTRIAGMPPGHSIVWNHPDIPFRINSIRPDKKLIALSVNHPVCRRATNAFRTDNLPKVRSDLIQLIG